MTTFPTHIVGGKLTCPNKLNYGIGYQGNFEQSKSISRILIEAWQMVISGGIFVNALTPF